MAIALSEKRTQIIVWTLLLLMPIVGMAVDLVAPSLPAIAQNLQASHTATKNIISIYLLGYALGNFCTGFLTDAIGRKKLIRLGLLAFVIVSLLPVLFPHIGMLLIARLLQGITLGSVAVLIRAIVSDVLSPNKLVRFGTFMGTMWGLGPVIGPVIGGYLQFYFGWQAGFIFFSVISFIGLIATFIIVPETHKTPSPLNLKTITKNVKEVVMNPLFLAITMLMGLAYSLIITFNTLGPFLIQTVMGFTPIFFGHLALFMGIIFLAATFVTRSLIKKHSVEKLYFIGINLFFAISVAALIISYAYDMSLTLITVTTAIMFFACGIIFPMSMGKGMSLFRHIAGTASAIMYLFNMIITSLTAFLVSFVRVSDAIPLMCIYAILLLISFFIYWSIIRKAANKQ